MDEQLEVQPNRTLLPRFSIRALFWIVTLSSLACVVFAMAARGHGWAWGVSIALASLVITAIVHAAWFGVAYLFSELPMARPKDAE